MNENDYTGTSIYWPVPTDPSCYGDECTADDAEIVSEHQAEMVRELIEEMAPGAEIEIAMVGTTGIGYDNKPRALSDDGDTNDDLVERIRYEVERRWVGWMEEALAE